MTTATAQIDHESAAEGVAAVATPLAAGTPDNEAAPAAANESGSKRTVRRPRPTGADLDRIGRTAKEAFARQYQGAVLKMPTQIRNHVVARLYRRTFATVLRNWNIATTVLRSAAGDAKGAMQIEIELITKLDQISKLYKDKKVQLEHLLNDNPDADLARKALSYQNPVDEQVAMVGPVSFKLRSLMLQADDLIDVGTVCYTLGALGADEFEKLKLQIKNTLSSVDSAARKCRELALQKSRDAGVTRPDYKGGTSQAEGAKAEAKDAVLTD